MWYFGSPMIVFGEDSLSESHRFQISDPEIASNSPKPVDQRIFYAEAHQIALQKRKETLLAIGNRFEIERGSPRPVRSDGSIFIKKRGLEEKEI